MANEEQLQRLLNSSNDHNGCTLWNAWRQEDQYHTPIDLSEPGDLSTSSFGDTDLSGADLSHANLSGIFFSGTNLSGADLSHANLSSAFLQTAILTNANLNGANLSGADLSDAILSDARIQVAILKEAKLMRANLRSADLKSADLSGANFTGADLSYTNLGDTSDARHDEILIDGNRTFKVKVFSVKQGAISLYEAQTEYTNLSIINWESLPWLGDEFSGPYWECVLNSRFLGWAEDYDYHLKSARAYQRLVKNLRDQNLNDEADKYAYRAKICQRRMHFRRILAWPTKLPQYLFSHLLNLIAGYGYKPERTVFWYLVTIFGFMYMYLHVSQGWAPFGLTTPTSLSPHLQWYEALILSVSSFHGRGFFQPVQSLGDPVAALAAIEAVIGLFIEVSFIATFTQRFFGK